ncbi:MAG: M14 family zinc carboxypeptidase [Acidobacteriota bacterium]
MSIQKLILAALLSLACVPPSFAGQIPLSLKTDVPGVEYSEAIPMPESILGHRIGHSHTRPDQIVRYFEAVAAASDRVIVERHGSTYEERPLLHAIVTSPENQLRLEQLREANLRLAEDSGAVSDSSLDDMPVVVWMGYSVHGNEASGSEAALLLLYHLAAGSGDPVDRVLQNCIVIIDPMLNPDGRARFVDWVNGNRGRVATSDPNDREHREPWPGGRTNHYWFDLNRDWLPVQLKESQGRLQLFYHWRPQLVTDFHEMGGNSTFFFMPGVASRTNPLTPQSNFDLTRRIAAFHARYLDRLGSLYYSEEGYDDYYYGKGSTYPDINGAIGILFEQASSRALKREVADGVLDYAFTIRNQFTASLSSLDAAVTLRHDLLAQQRDFYRDALGQARLSPIKGWLFDARDCGGRIHPLIETLLRHQIRIYPLARDLQVGDRTFPAGHAYIAPVLQPQTRLLQALMERVTDPEETVFYDVSTWTFPLAFNVDTVELRTDPQPYLGPRIGGPTRSEGRVEGTGEPYAYLMDWNNHRAPAALFALQEAGVRTRLLTRSIAYGQGADLVRFDRPMIVVPVHQQPLEAARIEALVSDEAAKEGVSFHGVDSGWTDEGPDLGGPSSVPLEKPSIALLCGPGTRSSEVGESWFVLNERQGIPVSLLEAKDISGIDLSRYNTLIVSGGNYRSVTDGGIADLKKWLQGGGLIIASDSGARWLIERELVDERLRERTVTTEDIPYEDVADARRSRSIPGSIFEAILDVTHPLAYGMNERLPVFRDHEILFEPSHEAGANVALYSDTPLLSGYVPEGMLSELKGSAAIIARRVGRGHVVLFADDPNFRAFWYGTSAVFYNAVFFGRSF